MSLKKRLLALTALVASTVMLAGCSEISYKVDIPNTETYTVAYEASIDRDGLEKGLASIGQDDTEMFIERYITDLKKNDSYVDLSDSEHIAFSVTLQGEVLKEEQTNGDALFVAQRKDGAEIIANIPINRLMPAGLKQVKNLNLVFEEFEVKATFPGQVISANFNGENDIFTRTVTWDTNQVVESIQRSASLAAVSQSSELFFLNPMFLAIVAFSVLALALIFVLVRVAIRQAHQVKLRRIAKEEAKKTAADWETATPEEWALNQISSIGDKDPMFRKTKGKGSKN